MGRIRFTCPDRRGSRAGVRSHPDSSLCDRSPAAATTHAYDYAAELLFKIAREHTKLFNQIGRPLCAMRGEGYTTNPEWGSPLWLFKHLAEYLRPKCLASEVAKSHVVRGMVLLINDQPQTLKLTDRLVYVEIIK